ncbi:hypothetical protein E6C27_scaffold130G00330 [Cucumis melo var. makuwa]|uniref:Uncharacterized protein n=1 Tax=Cucumis melo var. makuwa TaxID=1194695 RepID=A0A5A7V2L2_CUCMM|nr:hypothetical protein E6C27_scaffold130G00330 [Cucumis melo var. makuwa]
MYSVAIGRPVGLLRHSWTWGLTSLVADMTDLIWGMETRTSRPCTTRELTSRRTMYVHPDLLALQRVGPDQVDRRGRGEVSETSSLKRYIWRSTKQTSNSGRLRSGQHATLQMTTTCARNFFAYWVRCHNLRVWIGRYCKGIFCLVWTTFGVSYSCLRMRGRDFVESSYET